MGFKNLDTNATWGVDPEIWAFLQDELKDCLNPSSVHRAGQKARYLIEEAREDIKKLVNLDKGKVVFTSGASEANNLILNSIFPARDNLKNAHLILSAVEHISLIEPAQKLREKGLEVSFIKPENRKAYKIDDFISAIRPETKMLCLMYANNESGDIYPLYELAEAVKAIRPDIFIFSDAVQALGKSRFTFSESIDAISISAHKIGALPGTGALLIKDHHRLVPIIFGGPQEGRLRAGTENLPGIVSFGLMAKKLSSGQESRIRLLQESTEFLKGLLNNILPDIRLNKFSDHSLPNTLNICIPGIRSDDLVVALDLEGIFISSAAACSSGKPLPSHVLLAYGLSEDEARSSIRISLDDKITKEELRECALIISNTIKRMKINPISEAVVGHAA